MPEGEPDSEIPWIEPLPDSMLESVADSSVAPNARYELRETIRLAFIAATQRLPARQRAVLLLRDVLGWSANEAAEALKMTSASVNSALQRARATLGKGLSPDEISDAAGGEGSPHLVADKYANAWERADLDGLIALLAKDASLTMPPWRQWYAGRGPIRAFLEWAFDQTWESRDRGKFRMVVTRSNGQIAFGTYVRHRGERKLRAHALQVLTFRKGQIGRITLFEGPRFFPKFSLAAELAPA
jgi:RNA polymerase sigma-70 factor (ECF subfamily)